MVVGITTFYAIRDHHDVIGQ